MNEERVKIALRALADQDRELEAPARVEARLRPALRSRRVRRGWRRAALAGSMAAAMAIAAVAIRSHNTETPKIVPEVSAARPAGMPADANPATVQTPTKTVGSGTISEAAIQRPSSRQAARPGLAEERIADAPAAPQTLTDFIPLMNPEPPFERGEILRVNLPASAMQMVGLPVREDHATERVNADVLVGEEGLPRAIRFVSFEGR